MHFSCSVTVARKIYYKVVNDGDHFYQLSSWSPSVLSEVLSIKMTATLKPAISGVGRLVHNFISLSQTYV